MKKIIPFLFAFVFISHALEARIWRTNWPEMDSYSMCVGTNGAVVEFDLILEITDPAHPELSDFYLQVNGLRYYLRSFKKSQNGQYYKCTKRVKIPHNNKRSITYSVSHSYISLGSQPTLFKSQPSEMTTKNICMEDENSTIIYPKLAANSSIDRMNISPNPFNDNLNISYSLHNEDKVLIELLDLSGRVIKKMHFIRFGNNIEQLETSDLAPGVYYCKISTEANQNYIKVVKN